MKVLTIWVFGGNNFMLKFKPDTPIRILKSVKHLIPEGTKRILPDEVIPYVDFEYLRVCATRGIVRYSVHQLDFKEAAVVAKKLEKAAKKPRRRREKPRSVSTEKSSKEGGITDKNAGKTSKDD